MGALLRGAPDLSHFFSGEVTGAGVHPLSVFIADFSGNVRPFAFLTGQTSHTVWRMLLSVGAEKGLVPGPSLRGFFFFCAVFIALFPDSTPQLFSFQRLTNKILCILLKNSDEDFFLAP